MQLEKKILNTFAAAASSIGYSEIHGKILACLVSENKMLSLSDLSKKTGYSLPSISVSIDLLEMVGIIRKTRKDRNIYVWLDGDLLEGIRTAFLFKISKSTSRTLSELRALKKSSKNKNMVRRMELEVLRLDEYVKRLSRVKIPMR